MQGPEARRTPGQKKDLAFEVVFEDQEPTLEIRTNHFILKFSKQLYFPSFSFEGLSPQPPPRPVIVSSLLCLALYKVAIAVKVCLSYV